MSAGYGKHKCNYRLVIVFHRAIPHHSVAGGGGAQPFSLHSSNYDHIKCRFSLEPHELEK